MNINHSAEYIALWKSHKRAEWEAMRLSAEADKINRESAMATSRRQQVLVDTSVALAMQARPVKGPHGSAIAWQLQQESQRMQQLRAEIGAELERVEAALTLRQRKTAEKVLKQWEADYLRGMLV